MTIGCATGQPITLTKDSSVDEILDALDARGKDLKSFSSDVHLTQSDPQTGETTTDIGKTMYQLKDNGDGRIVVRFTQRVLDAGEKPVERRIDYLLDNGKLVDRDYKKKTQATNEIIKPGEKLNLLKLGEGPFPLPIGQPKDDVKKMFDVTKVEASKDDPVDSVHLKLVPKPDTRFSRQFNVLDTFVDLKQNMPVRIVTSKKGESERTADLSNVQINPALSDKDFELEKIDPAKWNISEAAMPDPKPAGSGASNDSKK